MRVRDVLIILSGHEGHLSAGTVCYDINDITSRSFLKQPAMWCVRLSFCGYTFIWEVPASFALFFAKIVKKSKNINDAERIVCYNKGGQKGAG